MLLIVALATVVVVTTSMVAQIERMAASNTMATERARANALFALDVALDQLQTAAGPDQRVSARADILQSGNATLTQPYWTGVWKSHNPANANNYELDAGVNALRPWSYNVEGPTWLVSQPDPSNPVIPETFAAADGITMATLQSLSNGTSNSTTVRVPRVPIMDAAGANQTSTGAYAYWIQDEGIKAKVNLVPSAASANVTNAVRYLAPSTTAAELALEGDWRTKLRNFLGGNATQLSKVKTPAMLDFVLGGNFSSLDDTNTNGLKNSSPDITTHSLGVLSDTRKGGLKTDLTAAFENVDNFKILLERPTPGRNESVMADDDLKGKLWRLANIPVPGNSGFVHERREGLTWFPFWHHYSLYKNKFTNPYPNTISEKDYAGLSGNLFNQIKDTPVNQRISGKYFPNMSQLRPVNLAVSTSFYFSTYDNGNGKAGLRFHYHPKLILYNPYNINISVNNSYGFSHNIISSFKITNHTTNNSSVILSSNSIRAKVASYDDKNKNGKQDPDEPTIENITNWGQSFSIANNKNHVLLPGELKVFSYKKDNESPAQSPAANQALAASSFLNLGPHGQSDDDEYRTLDVTEGYTVKMTGNFAKASKDLIDFLNGLELEHEVSIELERGVSNGVTLDGFNFYGDRTLDFERGKFKPIISRKKLSSFLGPVDGPGTHLATLFIRAKGLKALREPYVPVMGYAGSLYNFLLPRKSTYLWDANLYLDAAISDLGEIIRDADGRSYWGEYDVGSRVCEKSVVLREVFDKPLISIGQFKNINGSFNTHGANQNNQNLWQGSLVPVGNSWPDPEIASTDNTYQEALKNDQETLAYTIPGSSAALVSVDDVFLNNEALFDKFFFSTVPPENMPTGMSASQLPSEWNGFSQNSIDSRAILVNPRLKFYGGNGTSPVLKDLRDMDKAAANLLVDGAFNVNSTSVPAWRALLGSLRFAAAPTAANPIPRIISNLISSNSTNIPENYKEGIRVLTDKQLDDLSQAIVNQVKERGPFLNMADFVNRRRTTGDLGAKGALQAAIDDSEINKDAYDALGIGTSLVDGNSGDEISFDIYQNSNPNNGLNFAYVAGNTPHAPANTAEGALGVITQADLLQPLAPFLTARSDTFAIRVFGEAGVTTPQGNYRVEGHAYGEAIVQRVPDFVDQTDKALGTLNAALGKEAGNATPLGVPGEEGAVGEVNQKLGRRFKVVSFRWLNPGEI